MSWQAAPFVRFVVPLALGIISYQFPIFHFSLFFWSGLLIVIILLLFIQGFQKDPSIRTIHSWGCLATLGFITLGHVLSHYQDARHSTQHISHHSDTLRSYVAMLNSPPEQKTKSIKTMLQIKAVHENGTWVHCTGKVLAYIKLDTASIKLNYGDVLLLRSHIKTVEPPKNPAAFNTQKYYEHLGVYHQCYLPRENWQVMNKEGKWWWQQIYYWKGKLLAILKQSIVTPNEYAVASALLLGSKSDLDNRVKNAYADTGAMHILAVSGLHVGILIALLSFLLRFLNKLGTKGKRLRALLLLLFLWVFALLTGASPSVLRAGTMFSFLLLGQVLGKTTNIYNSLAASAFLLLCFNTNSLYNVGFQLSYLALIGILYLQPKIYALWSVKSRIIDLLWQGISVSLAAQLATAPLSLYYFHQFPMFFWLSSIVVTVLGGILLGLGIALLLCAQIPLLGSFLALTLQYLLFCMNSLIFGIQQLPWAVWSGFWLEPWQVVLHYFILIALVICLLQRRLPWGIAALMAVLLLVGVELVEEQQQRQQAELCIYNNRGSTVWSFIAGHQSFTWMDSSFLGSPQLSYLQENYFYSKGITQQKQLSTSSNWKNTLGQYNDGKGKFLESRLALYGPEQVPYQSGSPLKVDYVLIHNNPALYDINRIQQLYDYKTLVFDGSSSPWKRRRWATACDSLGITYIDVVKEGAFVLAVK